MSKKKLPKVSFPELEAMLKDMEELLTDEYGNPLPPRPSTGEKAPIPCRTDGSRHAAFT